MTMFERFLQKPRHKSRMCSKSFMQYFKMKCQKRLTDQGVDLLLDGVPTDYLFILPESFEEALTNRCENES